MLPSRFGGITIATTTGTAGISAIFIIIFDDRLLPPRSSLLL